MSEYTKTPQSRNEEILTSIVNGTEYKKTPQSREEELLLEIKDKIEQSGGSGVTPNPEGEATETLNKIGIDDTVYGIPKELPEVTSADEGDVLAVNASGEWEKVAPSGGIVYVDGTLNNPLGTGSSYFVCIATFSIIQYNILELAKSTNNLALRLKFNPYTYIMYLHSVGSDYAEFFINVGDNRHYTTYRAYITGATYKTVKIVRFYDVTPISQS